jgi:hypothetical protein
MVRAGLTTIDGLALLAPGDAHCEVVVGGLVIGLGVAFFLAPSATVTPATRPPRRAS